MSLLHSAMEKCTILTSRTVSDGIGGTIDTNTDGKSFMATIVFDNSTEAKIAQAQGVRNLYTVTTGREITLRFHDIFRRERDGKTFRVTSDGDDKLSPAVSTLNMRQVSAEEWSVPDE